MSVRIGLGASGFPFGGTRDFFRWIDICEGSAVDSVWISDRLISTQFALEPMAAMAVIAGRTRRLKFGMNAIVLPFRDPLVLAKECATLDYLSDGRLLPVFGVGAETAPEWRATSREAAHRGSRSDEMLTIMSRLWAEESVTFAGKYYQYEGASIAPRPVQQPLPLWIGGSSDAAIRRTAAIGTGWLGGIQAASQVAPVVAKIRAKAKELGRRIDDDHYGAGFTYRFGSPEDPLVEQAARNLSRLVGSGLKPSDFIAAGSAETIIARAREYHGAGISKFVLRPVARDAADYIDQTQRLIDEVIPVVHSW